MEASRPDRLSHISPLYTQKTPRNFKTKEQNPLKQHFEGVYFQYMKKIFTTGLAAGIAMLAVGMLIINPVFMRLFPEFQAIYENPAIFNAMDDPLMSLFFVYPIVLGFALAWVWNRTKQLFTGSVWQAGFNFGLAYFFVAALPAFFINLGSFNIPAMMVVSWTVMSFVNGIVGGWVLAKLNR